MDDFIQIPSRILTSKHVVDKYVLNEDDDLGSGGFGKVYSALCKKDSKQYAIKFQYFPEDHYEKNVDREIKTIKELGNHPHIIKNIDYFPEPEMQKKHDFNFIVMELADKSLFSMLHPKNKNKIQKMKKSLLIQMVFDVIDGLKYANSKNIFHSDIKPGNILILEQSRKKKNYQDNWVEDQEIVFKICDWGIARMAKIGSDKTATLKNNDRTVAFASPEMNDAKGKLKVNLMKADIYSLGLVILNCCGVDHSEFLGLNYTLYPNDHKHNLKRILLKYDVKNEYGEDMVDLIKNMLKFDHTDRYGFKRISESLNEMAQELKTQANKCLICEKENHSQKLTLVCGHVFGTKCLERFLCDEFENSDLYLPRCPLDTCEEVISRDVIKQLIEERGDSDLKKYFAYCKNSKCERSDQMMYKTFLPKLSCNHRFCEDCLIEAKKCPKCQEPVKKKDREIINELSDQCRICQKEVDTRFEFSCCNVEICEKCLITYFLKDFYSKKNNAIVCLKCEKNFSGLDISKILAGSSIKLYNQKLCNECNRYQKNVAIIPKCEHKICIKCLKRRKSNRHCPSEHCMEKIPNEVLDKYRETGEESTGNGTNKNNPIEANSKKTTDENITKASSMDKNNTINTGGKGSSGKEKENTSSRENTGGKERSYSTVDNLNFFPIPKEFPTKIEEKKPSFECSRCKTACQSVLQISDCKHKFCVVCLEKNLTTRLENISTQPKLLKCLDLVCLKTMKLSDLKETLPPPFYAKFEAAVNKTIPEVEEAKEKTSLCESCKRDLPEKEFVLTADCCKKNCCLFCLRKEYTTKIDQKLWDSLACPCCNNPLTYRFIMRTAGKDLWQKYDLGLYEKAVEEINMKEGNTPPPPKEEVMKEDNLKKD